MDTKARLHATRAVPGLALRLWLAFGVLAIGGTLAVLRPVSAQEAQDELATAEDLRELVGPIALYPDDLVAIVLPASTYPLQVVQAARFLEDRKHDASLKPNEDWDDSIVALLNYPEVIELLNDDLDWTYDLGTAVLNQRADVLSAIQDFRDEAYAAGNLRSDERQTVARNDDAIEIKPADPKVIYVPYYEPERVVVYQPAPVYYYYPVAYPVYYYPYPAHYHFSTGFFWGVNVWFSIGWHSHYLHVYDPFYYGHPYYGWTYYNPFYVRNVYVNVNHYYNYPNHVWEPRYRYGGRPVTRSTEGRVYGPHVTRTREGPVTRPPGSPPDPCSSCSPPHGTDGTPPAGNAVTHTARGRSTAPRAPMGQSTQANEGSNGRSTRAQGPNGQSNHGQTHQPRASADTARTRPAQDTQRSAGGIPQAAERNRATAQPNANAEPRTSPGATRANPRSVGRANSSGSTNASRAQLGQGAYRSGGGMSQAAERSRAMAPSTGMPQQSSRGGPPVRQQSFDAAPPARQQSFSAPPSHGGGMSSVQRSEAPRGNSGGGNGGGSYRGGGGDGGNGGGHQRGGGSHAGGRTR